MTGLKIVVISIVFCALYGPAFGQPKQFCYEEAAGMYGINADVLYSIAEVESWHDPYAANIKIDGKYYAIHPRSYEEAVALVEYLKRKKYVYDLGIGQISSGNIKYYKIDPIALLDPCYNLHWSAYILREMIGKYGYGWKAIARYNGADSYAWKVYRALNKLQRVPRTGEYGKKNR